MLTTNEATGMHEDAFLDSRKLRERIVTNTSPGLRESLATREALWRDRDSLNAPLTASLVGIDHVDRLLGWGDGKILLKFEEMLL